ncbi:hypothetical protein MWU75_08095 [Ornithinimicrobium sp. F0845]|uniref:hypothetical protein n=1 Tax=Ornithinimicrobium sp. F0845 TaxID=2926412 RepID=UPI001FF52961|nr:hypothetical protein [Ornithinimicrobium sp. F0845]MCK0112094.1 hypothetical protein [Ornithinimicrobium sp. F0845]
MSRRRGRVATIVAATGLVVSFAGWGWFVSEQGREGWWSLGQHVAITPDDQGRAVVDSLSVRLTGAATVSEVEEEPAPAGFSYLVLDFEVSAEDSTEASTCDVQVRDDRGRLFQAGQEVPYADPYLPWLTCGSADHTEDPVPSHQSMLVLVPDDTGLVSVRVDAREFPPATFIELPLPPDEDAGP